MGVKKNNKNQKPNEATSHRPSCYQSGGEDPASQPSPEARIWQVVAMIPKGKVASYGQVARLAGLPNQARRVGRTLSRLPHDSKLPWHRVVNAGLRISLTGSAHAQARARLEQERVEFIGERIAPGCRWAP